MIKLLTGLAQLAVALCGVGFLFFVGLAYDRLPAGWPAWQVKCCFGVVNFTVHAPGAGAVTAANQRATAEGVEVLAYQTAEGRAIAHASAVQAQDARINAEAMEHDEAAQASIQTRYRTILKEIPSVITPSTDARFPLSDGFVRIHDAAASGLDVSSIPLPTGQSDDTASGITASDAGAVIAANYGACRQDDQQLSDLQAWLRNTAASHAR